MNRIIEFCCYLAIYALIDAPTGFHNTKILFLESPDILMLIICFAFAVAFSSNSGNNSSSGGGKGTDMYKAANGGDPLKNIPNITF